MAGFKCKFQQMGGGSYVGSGDMGDLPRGQTTGLITLPSFNIFGG